MGVVLAALWALPGQAQQRQPLPPEQGGLVVLKRADCARLTAHVPDANVAYQSGVDVRGRPVVPADLNPAPPLVLPDDVTIAITVDLQQRFGIPASSSLYKPEASIGTVVVRPDGSATFNGQPLTNQEQSALAFLCQKQGPLGPR
ncbi:MAG: hypothetical protein ACK4NA_05010 [Alphaproteobacteria bacterium]